MTQPLRTTQELADDYVAQIDGETGQSTPLLEKAFTRVLAKVQAGRDVLLYKYGAWNLLQQFVATASMRETTVLGKTIRPLVEHGRLLGVGDPMPATQAELQLTVTVLTASGSLAAGRELVYPPTGIVYRTIASVALVGSSVTVTARANSDQQGGNGAGVAGNLPLGSVLQFANPLPNVGRNVTVTGQTVTGAAAESEIEYRARIVRRAQQKPQGGAFADYAQWGEEAPGIVQVYPYKGLPGQVDLYVEATPESAGNEDGIPTPAQRAAVLAYVQQDGAGMATRRPVNAAINVYGISRVAFDVWITGLEVDDDAGAKLAIEDAVDEYLRAREPFIVGLSVLPRIDRITLAGISGIVDDVVSALGGSVAQIALQQSGETIPAYTLGDGQKAKLGTITYV